MNVRLQLWLCGLLVFALLLAPANAQRPGAPPAKRKAASKEDLQRREKSLRQLADHLQIGAGCSIADIGAGNGPDTWIFAGIVGRDGKVFAEEIDTGKTQALEKEAKRRDLPQVSVVLGKPNDPALPAGSVDLAFMHQVYHHFSQPREMLQGIWRGLKPGGYLVIVDQRLGTLQDWVPLEDRAGKHYWTAETTVVREAREQGFHFVEGAEKRWHEKNAFALVFRRPTNLPTPDRDPDAPPAISASAVQQLLPATGEKYQRVAFVALGAGRELIKPIMETTGGEAVDIVLEEWATQKDERPAVPAGVSLTSVLTEKGDPHLGPEPLDAVYFLDTYHLLFHAPQLLAQLHQRLAPAGRIYVLDREAAGELARREASHHRRISPEVVKQEMSQAGFAPVRQGAPPAAGRFVLVFGKSASIH